MKCLAVLKDGAQICFEHLCVILPNGKEIPIHVQSRIKHYLCHIRLFERLLRLEPRCGAFLTDDLIVITFQRHLFILSIYQEKIIKTIPLRNGFSDVLSFCSMNEYGEQSIYFGDYGMNSEQKCVNIYKLNSQNYSLEVLYSFPNQTVRHIHNILYDKWRDRFIIFTGDEGEYAGIYLANKDFSKVTAWKCGKQQFRAVAGRMNEQGLIYATDAVTEDNGVYYISFNNDSELKKICSLDGSVIYGCNINKGLIFSTTVEPYPSKKSRLLSLLDNRRGPGIKSNFPTVFLITDGLIIKKIRIFEKDILPMRLFQYGCIQFPALASRNLSDIICNGVAIYQHDGKSFKIELS